MRKKGKKTSIFIGVWFMFTIFWKYRKSALFFLLAQCLLGGALPFAAIIIPKYIIDELTSQQNLQILISLTAILLGCTLFGNSLVNFFSNQYFVGRLRCSQLFSLNMYNNLYEADLEHVEASSFLDLFKQAMTFATADGMGFGGVLQKFANVSSQVITLAGIISIIALLNPVVVLVFIVLALATTWFNSVIKKLNIQYRLKSAEIDRRCGYIESIYYTPRFVKEIRANTLGTWLRAKMAEMTLKVYDFNKKSTRNELKSQIFGNIAAFIQQGAAYVYLFHGILNGKFSIGSFTMYVTAINVFSGAMFSLMDSVVDIRRFSDYYDAMDAFLKFPRSQREGKRLTLRMPASPVFEFRNVSFRYPNQKNYTLTNINLVIRGEEKLSVVGENGAGKTTFTKLLMRLYRPTEGQILLNGVDIQDYDFDDYQRVFSTVFQDFALYSMSLRDNVTNGREASDDQIREVLEQSGFRERLDHLKNGLDTAVYKDMDASGFEPSGGEGQKIAMARALLKGAPVVILDEPTAALDPRAEYEMYMRFNEMVHGKTAIFISHRLASVKFCDQVAVFKNGEIAEYGTHDELMKKQGLYHELFTMQAQFYTDTENGNG